MSLPMISPRHVSAATRGCLVWEDPDDEKLNTKIGGNSHHHNHNHSSRGSSSHRRHHHHHHSKKEKNGESHSSLPATENNNAAATSSSAEDREKKHHKHHHHHHHHDGKHKHHSHQLSPRAQAFDKEYTENQNASSPGRARVGPPPTLSILHRAGGHEHDSNEGIKQSIFVERHQGGRIFAFPAWGGAGGGYYSCFNYKGGKDARGRYDGAFDIIPTKDTQGRRRVNDHDTLAIGATASSFVPTEKPQGLRAVRPPQREQPRDGQSARGLHQDIGLLNVEPRPSRKKTADGRFAWMRNQFNVMTEAQAPTDTRTNFQVIADAKRERNRQARRDFLAHLKSEGQFKAVNRVPIRSTLTQRRWDVSSGGNNNSNNGGGEENGNGNTNANSNSNSNYPAHPPMSAPSHPSARGRKGGSDGHVGVYESLSPRARKYLGYV